MDEKRCTKCGEIKPFNKFSKNKRGKDGYQSYCKSCVGEYWKEHKTEIIAQRRSRLFSDSKEKTNVIKKVEIKRDERVQCYIDFNLHKEIKRESRKYDLSTSRMLIGMIYFYFDNYKE